MIQSDYNHLIGKLDGFIRRYYKDRLLRGALYSTGLLISVFLLATLLEHVGRFSSEARTALFWMSSAAMLAILFRYIALPLFRLFKLGAAITHSEAARIIGAHFPDVRDKLLNTLQLHEMGIAQPGSRDLIEAAIAQRSHELRPVPFARAVDLRRNSRYLRFALPPLGLLLVLLFAAPSMITGPAQRLLHHGTEYRPEAPFAFLVLNDSLTVAEEHDFDLSLRIKGAAVPMQVDLVVDGARIPMTRSGPDRFAHRFRNVSRSTAFHFLAEGFESDAFELAVVPEPLVLGLVAELEFPTYLNMPLAVEQGAGDLTVPAGTRITWSVRARSTDRMAMAFDDTLLAAPALSIGDAGAEFRLTRRMLSSHAFELIPQLKGRSGSGALKHRVEVTPDLHPTITLRSLRDSLSAKRVYFNGEVSDDHGFRRLVFHYRFAAGGDSIAPELRQGAVEVPIDARVVRQSYFHLWDLLDMRISPGDRIEHWFEVWDNDGVNGSKSARTPVEVFAAPSQKEIADREEARSESTKESLRESIKEAQSLQRELDKLRRDLLEKNQADWQDKQRLQQVLERQKQLEQRIERSTQQLRESQQERRDFSPADERLLEKQQRIQELFENVLSEEMKELYRKVEELIQSIDKEQLQEQLREMKLDQVDVEKELDRALEMFKRMEVEQKAEDIAKQLRDLAERQEKLAEESADGKRSSDQLEQEQEKLNKEFEELRKDMDELGQKNQELETPMNIPDTEGAEEQIGEQQKQSSEQLGRNQSKKAAGNQKAAAEGMEQLAHQMESAMSDGAQEQEEEDMEALRQLLENILHLSFDQEALLGTLAATATRDPRWVAHGREQRKLRDDARVIEDSLMALSKRVPQIQSVVNREMNAVNDNMDEARRLIGEARANERFKPMAADKQQHAMTSLNNLALLLDEALQQMMQQMNAQSKPGSGSCNKPGKKPGEKPGSAASLAKAKSQQQALQKQLDEMRKALEQGKKPGDRKGQGSMGMPGMSQQLAQLAAQQAAVRKEMQRLAQELNKDGSGAGNEINKLAQQMEQQERDIVNRDISPETLRRQQDILVRLLEHEKAEREREFDNKRESREGGDGAPPDPARLFEHQRAKAREAELLRTVPAGLKPYYRDRVNAYFGTFGHR